MGHSERTKDLFRRREYTKPQPKSCKSCLIQVEPDFAIKHADKFSDMFETARLFWNYCLKQAQLYKQTKNYKFGHIPLDALGFFNEERYVEYEENGKKFEIKFTILSDKMRKDIGASIAKIIYLHENGLGPDVEQKDDCNNIMLRLSKSSIDLEKHTIKLYSFRDVPVLGLDALTEKHSIRGGNLMRKGYKIYIELFVNDY